MNYGMNEFKKQADAEYEAIQRFKEIIEFALDESRDAHHLGGDLGYLRIVFDQVLNNYIGREYQKTVNYNRELTREEKLRCELKPRHKKAILERDKYRCTNCGSHKNLCVDHKTPISRGGDNHESNLHTLCRKCNGNKGQKTMKEWHEWLGVK